MFITAEAEPDRESVHRQPAMSFRGWLGRPSRTVRTSPGRRIDEPMPRRLRAARARKPFGGLGMAWLTFLGLAVAVGGTLEALGPPSAGAATSARAASAKPRPESIAALLARVGDAISDSPDGAPPGADAAQTLQKVAAALPGAAPEDRQLANDTASDLFDRARIALNAGQIAEEQRWLALGAILAPPPDLRPVAGTVQPGGADKALRQDFTPNETEAEAAEPSPNAAAQARPAGSGGDADKPASPPSGEQNTADASAASALAIHVASGSAAAGATAKTLAERLGSAVRTETAAASEAPPGAVICYANPNDHERAKAIGEMLGGMGYYWRLQRAAAAPATPVTTRIDVWLPQGGATRGPPAALSDNYCAARL